MILQFKLIYHQFEPIRESLSSTYSYEWTGQLLHYQVKREGRINEEQEGSFPLPNGAEIALYHFLSTNDLLSNRKIKHDPFNHPSAYEGSDGLDITIECQMSEQVTRQYYRGTSVQLEPYARSLHELWRLVHRFLT